jgi:branched-chain amino acid transport system substrate-binding protein
VRPAQVLLLAAALASTAARAEELAKLNLAMVLPLSGPQEPFGKETAKGVELALEALRQQDPDLASRIALLSGDEQAGGGAAAVAAKLFDKERANLLIGSVTNGATIAAAGEARKRQAPMLAPVTAQTAVPAGGGLFRACAGEGTQGAILAEFALTVLGVKQAATLREDGLAATPLTERFAAAFAAGGGAVTAQETYALGTEDFTPALKKILASGAKLIITPAPYQTAAAMIQQGKNLAPDLRFLGGAGWDTPALPRAAGAAARGSYFVAPFTADDPDPVAQAFVKAFKTKFGREPGALAAEGYDTALLAFDAFKRARTSLKGALTEAIAKTAGLTGATGQLIAFDGGEAIRSAAIKELTDGGAKFKGRVAPHAPPAVATDGKGPGTPLPAKGH